MTTLQAFISALAVLFTVGVATPPTLTRANNGPITSIGFSSAVQLEASLSAAEQHSASASSQAVFYPPDTTKRPEYAIIEELAPVLPPVQAGLALPGVHDLVEAIPSTGTAFASDDTLRVMIVGDSISEGKEGDWTWRYRIWQWFQKNKIPVRFVGPYKGTVDSDKPSQPQPPPLYGSKPQTEGPKTNGGYARGVDKAFLSNCNHFSVWGRAAAVDKGLIRQVLEQNPADMVLLMLGFNDMGWFYSDAIGTIDSIKTLIENARAANSRIKIAVANVPHRTFIGGREDLEANTNLYNGMLPDVLSKLSTAQSPIHLVDIEKHYECSPRNCPAGYDGLHPTAWGEYLIAQAFSETLVKNFKMGSSMLDIPSRSDPILSRSLPAPSNFKVFSSPQGVTATWDPVYGAYGYELRVSVNGASLGSPQTVTKANRWDSQWALDGWEYAISVRAVAGDGIYGDRTTTRKAKAKPEVPPPPQNVQIQVTGDGFRATWDPPKGTSAASIVEYNIIYWDWNPDHCQYVEGAAFKSSPGVVTGLKRGVNYFIAVVAWNKYGEGFPYVASNVVPGSGVPAAPSGLKVDNIDQTSVRITWKGSDRAGGYRVWSRNVHDKNSQFKILANVSDSSCNEEYFLFPGVWNYAFAVSAFNGDTDSNRGPQVVASSESGKATHEVKCPPKSAWCPGGGEVSVPPGSPTRPGGDPTITGPVPTDSSRPIVTNGRCNGRDCKHGVCEDIICASFGCIGDDCVNGRCKGHNCTPLGCIGPNCRNGVCIGPGCVTNGCVGPQCSHHRCKGTDCIAIGCIGQQCSGSGMCSGPNCAIRTCTGINCIEGVCVGPGCIPGGGSTGGGDDAPDECTTHTFPSCSTLCSKSASKTKCSSTCTDIEACTTPTPWRSTLTPAAAYTAGIMEMWPEIKIPDPELPDVAQKALQSLSKIGDFPTPTQTHSFPPPPYETVAVLQIFIEEYQHDGPNGQPRYVHSWTVCGGPATGTRPYDNIDPCGAAPVYTKSFPRGPPPGTIVQPPDLGPFKVEDFECSFKPNAEINSLQCDKKVKHTRCWPKEDVQACIGDDRTYTDIYKCYIAI